MSNARHGYDSNIPADAVFATLLSDEDFRKMFCSAPKPGFLDDFKKKITDKSEPVAKLETLEDARELEKLPPKELVIMLLKVQGRIKSVATDALFLIQAQEILCKDEPKSVNLPAAAEDPT